MIQLLIASAAKAALVLGLAALLAGLLHAARPATRHLLWLAGLVASLLVLPLSLFLPELHLGLVESRSAGPALNLLVILGLAGAAAVLVHIAIGHVVLNRLAAKAGILGEERLTALARAAAAEMGVDRRFRLLSWPGPMPATFGTVRPTILLPEAARDWPDERARLVLLHELAHIARGDAASLVLARIAAGLNWFNPLAWQGLRRLRAECEQACDDLVLGTGTDPVAYARTLLQTVEDGGARAAPAGALTMTAVDHLEARLGRILAAPRARRAAWPLLAAAAAVMAAALLLAPLRFETGGDETYSAAVPAS